MKFEYITKVPYFVRGIVGCYLLCPPPPPVQCLFCSVYIENTVLLWKVIAIRRLLAFDFKSMPYREMSVL